MDYYRSVLKNEFEKRCDANKNYSLRSFARALQMDPSTLSRVLSCSTVPSLSTAKKISKSISLTPEKHYQFIESVNRSQVQRNTPNIPEQLHAKKFETEGSQIKLLDSLIYELLGCDDFDASPTNIAERIGIDEKRVLSSLHMLANLGLVAYDDGKYQKETSVITNSDKKEPSIDTVNYVSESLDAAQKAFKNFNNDTCKFETKTFAINPKLLPEAKQRVESFADDMDFFLQHDTRSSVYQLQIQLFPLEENITQL